MYRLNALSSFLVPMMALTLVAGCSDSTAPDGDNQTDVTVQTEMTTNRVAGAANKPGAVAIAGGVEADSLVVTRARILISELKLHRDKEDSIGGDKTVKTGPILLTIDPAGARTATTGLVPVGTYDKLKFEFHRFSGSEVATYLNDTTFAPFVTDDRYTFILDGTVYSGGQAHPFTYRSQATANLSLKFDPAVQFADAGTTVIVLRVDPLAIFKDGGKVLDPRDGGNRSKIDNAIKDAVKVLKK